MRGDRILQRCAEKAYDELNGDVVIRRGDRAE